MEIEINSNITWDENEKWIALLPMIGLIYENKEITIGIIFLIFNTSITFKLK